MALEDKDIFNAIFSKYSDQPLEFVMEQYEKAKRLNSEIEKRQCACMGECSAENALSSMEGAKEEAAPRKKYTKRSLMVKPETAITDDHIACCICGEEKTILTSKHLGKHGLTPVEYKALCGYAKDKPLMSNKRAELTKKIIAKAQKARMEKRAVK